MSWISSWWPWPRRRKPSPPTPNPPPAPAGDWGAQMLAAHNAARQARGLSPLRESPRLGASAQEGIDLCARAGRLDHGDPWARMLAHGYAYRQASENMAEGQTTAAEAVNDWLRADAGHRDNVLGPWLEAGFGRAAGRDGKIYWSADYATPL